MRYDDPSLTSSPASTSEAPTPRRARALAWYSGFAVLVVLTSLALTTVSVWMVVPYLVLMSWILLPARPTRDPWLVRPFPGPRRFVSEVEASVESTGSEIESRSPTSPAEESDVSGDLGETAPEPSPVKTKRGKGRGRKAKAVVAEPAAGATWIRVGPGQFVRADGPSPSTESPLPTSDLEPGPEPVDPTPSDDEGRPESPPPVDLDAPTSSGLEGVPEPVVPLAEDAPTPSGHIDLEAIARPDPLVVPASSGLEDVLEPAAPIVEDAPTPSGHVEDEGIVAPELFDTPSPSDVEPDEEWDSAADLDAPTLSADEAGPEPAFPDEIVAEFPQEPEVCTADFDAPGTCDEDDRGGPTLEEPTPECDEALPPNATAEGDAGSSDEDVEPSTPFESHHEDSCWDDAGREERPAFDPGDDTLEDVGDADVAAETLLTTEGMEGLEIDGPVLATEDKGIAPEVFEAEPIAPVDDLAPEVVDEVQPRLDVPPTPPTRPASNASPVPRRLGRLRVASAAIWTPVAVQPGRTLRPGRNVRVSPGFRQRSRRSVGRYQQLCRTFPPRSPPSPTANAPRPGGR